MDTSPEYRKSVVNPLEPLEKVEVIKWYKDPIYIKMCKKAEEIQGLRPFGKAWVEGDGFITTGKLTKFRVARRHKNDIWLPRQDQLQAMVGDFDDCLALTHDFQCPECNAFDDRFFVFTSMEQLWLAFVMKAKGKVWNGEDWVNE